MDDGNGDASLQTLFEHEAPDARLIVDVVHADGQIVAVGGQLADFEPDHQIVFAVQGGRAAGELGQDAEFGAGDGGGDGQSVGEVEGAAAVWGRGSEDVENILGGQVGRRLVVAEDFEDDGLVFDVVDEGLGDGDGDVLGVTEMRRSRRGRGGGGVSNWLRGKGFVMPEERERGGLRKKMEVL